MPASPTRSSAARDPAYGDAVAREVARRSFAGWARKRFHILTKLERDATLDLGARPGQRAALDAEAAMLRETGRARLIVLKGRQGGITTYAQARALHAVFTEYGARALTVADTEKRTAEIFSKVTSYAVDRFDLAYRPKLGAARAHEITVPALASSFYTATAGSGDTGLGLTLRRIHGSEFSFWEHPKKTLRAMAPSVNHDGTTILLESTASVFDSEAHHFWRDARDGKNGYRALVHSVAALATQRCTAPRSRRLMNSARSSRTNRRWSRGMASRSRNSSGGASRSRRAADATSSCNNTPRTTKAAGSRLAACTSRANT